jgi:hypothetical protein
MKATLKSAIAHVGRHMKDPRPKKPINVEWELAADGTRTGRWRRKQFYGPVDDRRVPGARTPCEWREGPLR